MIRCDEQGVPKIVQEIRPKFIRKLGYSENFYEVFTFDKRKFNVLISEVYRDSTRRADTLYEDIEDYFLKRIWK